MDVIENHLEQISLSAVAISDLPFPSSKIFTNALLHSHDITSLIRDAEPHERALFNYVPQNPRPLEPNTTFNRRTTAFNVETRGEISRIGTRTYENSTPIEAVGRSLKGGVLDHIKGEGDMNGRITEEINIHLLLSGAERLCKIYPIEGGQQRIDSLRLRHEQLASSIARYEERTTKQAVRLDEMTRSNGRDNHEDLGDCDEDNRSQRIVGSTSISEEAIRYEELEVRELEEKKRSLEERVSGMEKDLGGLMR